MRWWLALELGQQNFQASNKRKKRKLLYVSSFQSLKLAMSRVKSVHLELLQKLSNLDVLLCSENPSVLGFSEVSQKAQVPGMEN